jgi:NADPH:quinone reductase-like Zn-dependent oxidoreductase
MRYQVPDKMVAVFVDPESRRLSTSIVDVPVPKKGEVLVRMKAAPVNPSDLARVREVTAEEAADFIPGVEGCGTVVAAGKGILPRIFLGKRVACSSHYKTSGTWAEYMVTTAGSCFPAGKKVSDEQAAMTLVNPMTALALLDIARKGKHMSVVNTAASGALGRLIATLFERHGIQVLNVVRSGEAKKELESLGRKYVLNSLDEGFEASLNHWCEARHCTLMLDAVGGEMVNRVLDVLPDGSTIILYGNLSLKKIEFQPPQLVRRSKKIAGFVLSHWIAEKGTVRALLNLIRIRRMLKKGLETRVQAVFPIEEAQEAVELYQGNMGKGKVLLKP